MPGVISSAAPEYKSWIAESSAKDASLYSGVAGAETNANAATRPDDDTPNPLVKMIASMIAWIGTAVSKALNEMAGVPCNITGIIMGKVTTGKNYFVFDMTKGNIYGIIGSYLYVALQNVALSFVFVASLLSLVISMWKGDGRGGKFLRDNIIHFAGALLLLYLMPLIADAVCNMRDAFQIFMYKTLNGFAGTGGVNYMNAMEDVYYEQYSKVSPNLVNALVYTAVCVLPIMYIVAYVKVAIMQLILFGLFPMFVFASFLDGRKAISEWCVTFFTNCFIPVIDMTLLLLPAILINLLEEEGMSSKSFLKALISIVMFMAVVPTRNQVLKMLGNNWGISNGNGLLGVAAAGAAAIGKGIAGGAHIANSIRNGINSNREKKDQKNDAESQASERHQAADQLNKKVDNDIPTRSESSKTDSIGSSHKDDGPLGDIGERSEQQGGDTPGADNHGGDRNDRFSKYDSETFGGNKQNDESGDGSNQQAASSHTEELAEVQSRTDTQDDFAVGRNDVIDASNAFNPDDPAANSEFSKMANDVISSSDTTADADFNSDRLANLATMDNINDRMDSINKENAALNMENASTRADLNMAERLDAKMSSGQTLSADETKFMNDKGTDMLNNKSALEEKMAANSDKIALNNASKQALNLEHNRRADIEKEFAKSNEAIGKSGKTYTNASDFAKQAKIDARLANSANIKNFADKKYDGVLSNQQRLDFQRKAERREMAAKVVSLGARTGVSTAAAVGGFAAVVGGGTDADYFNGTSSSATRVVAGAAAGAASYLQYDSKGIQDIVNAAADGFGDVKNAPQNAQKFVKKMEQPAVNHMKSELAKGAPYKSGGGVNSQDKGVERHESAEPSKHTQAMHEYYTKRNEFEAKYPKNYGVDGARKVELVRNEKGEMEAKWRNMKGAEFKEFYGFEHSLVNREARKLQQMRSNGTSLDGMKWDATYDDDASRARQIALTRMGYRVDVDKSRNYSYSYTVSKNDK